MMATELMMSVMLVTSLISSIGTTTLMVIFSLIYPVAYWIFGYRMVHYSNSGGEIEYQKASTYIKNRVLFQSYTSAGQDLPTGLVFGRYFVAYTKGSKGDHGATNWEIWLWSRQLPKTNDPDVGPNSNTKTLTSLYDDGNVYHNSWTTCEKNVLGKALPFQSAIVQKIVEMMKTSEKNGYGFNITVMIYGGTGTGKSHISELLALELNAKYCVKFSPLKPRSGQDALHATAAPTRDVPLVVALNEFDTIAEAAHKYPLTEVPKFPPAVYDKGTYNNFMDGLCKFPNTAYILTSNYPPSWFDALDTDGTAIRAGRVNLFINMADYPDAKGIASSMEKERFAK